MWQAGRALSRGRSRRAMAALTSKCTRVLESRYELVILGRLWWMMGILLTSYVHVTSQCQLPGDSTKEIRARVYCCLFYFSSYLINLL